MMNKTAQDCQVRPIGLHLELSAVFPPKAANFKMDTNLININISQINLRLFFLHFFSDPFINLSYRRRVIWYMIRVQLTWHTLLRDPEKKEEKYEREGGSQVLLTGQTLLIHSLTA